MSTGSEKKKCVALFGGTFDPPHIGHYEFCRDLAGRDEFDEVWILPAYIHAFNKPMSPFDHRMKMCEIAFCGISQKILTSDEEQHCIGGYTIDLVRHLLKKYPEIKFVLTLGSDNYEVRSKWKDFGKLQELIQVKFFGRKGWQMENEMLELDAPFPEASSSEIRDMIAAGIIPHALLPPGIAGYIAEHKLYR